MRIGGKGIAYVRRVCLCMTFQMELIQSINQISCMSSLNHKLHFSVYAGSIDLRYRKRWQYSFVVVQLVAIITNGNGQQVCFDSHYHFQSV